MPVTPLMVKELRDKTGAGMLDCKKALEASDCNIEQAIVWLREKGISKAEKKASRVAAEGLCSIVTKGNEAVIYEINSETDFVAQNDKFKALVANVGEIIINSDAKCTDCALAISVEDKTLKQVILEASGTIGEKLSLRRVSRVTKNDNQVFGAYKHMGGRIVSLVVLDGNNEVCAKDVAMHVAALNPQYLSHEDIPSDVVAKEREILLVQALEENKNAAKPKPDAIIEKMVEGRLNKNFKEVCLLEQPFVKNPDQTVGQYVASCGTKVASFARLEVGEGIEKEVVDFAAEVALQAGLSK